MFWDNPHEAVPAQGCILQSPPRHHFLPWRGTMFGSLVRSLMRSGVEWERQRATDCLGPLTPLRAPLSLSSGPGNCTGCGNNLQEKNECTMGHIFLIIDFFFCSSTICFNIALLVQYYLSRSLRVFFVPCSGVEAHASLPSSTFPTQLRMPFPALQGRLLHIHWAWVQTSPSWKGSV
jgi:hypothetical protein